MTQEAYLKHKDLIEAWANGAEIEVLTDYRWGVNYNSSIQTYGTVYMSEETAFKLVDLLNNGEVVE